MLKAWMNVFPGLVKPYSSIPAAVKAHVRYPEDLFEVQRSLLGTYHVSNPVTFYNVGDKWTVPSDPNAPDFNQPPYYVLASNPSTQVSAPEFQLTSPMVVNSKPNLAAYISVSSDYGSQYGKFTVLRVPTSSVTKGPEQVRNILNTNPVISKDLSLFNSANGGSSVVYGNLLTLPLGNSFLYVEPLYVQAAGGNGSYPILQRVLVSYGSKIGYADTLENALANLNQPQVGLNIGNGTSPGTGGGSGSPPSSPTASPSSGSSTGNSQQVTLEQINAAINALKQAYTTGDPAKIGLAEANLQHLIEHYSVAPSTPAPKSSSATPSKPAPSTSSSASSSSHHAGSGPP
jgi:hypothetical protein